MKGTHPSADVNMKIIGPTTGIQIVLVIGFLTICGGGFGGSIWWASSISTKLDAVLAAQRNQETSVGLNRADIAELKLWKERIESNGSLPCQRKFEKFGQDMLELQKDWAVHKRTMP